ncbi:helix-turn-helix domain-containing protein [Amycolatopsis thermophila]|uniref:Transcriptional regulator with XRE-family HTH domain n=1 Tax=Amycolatopsis thermophila TaxID=206084 RepID=A0ABU0EUE9_9PSEU|nr:helix-turn-helix transcriptional regulator [Amycolatopsis thermophila]MDQ0378606.1 transcriptional regulator with XRE-family HTH domain [Amycolatopsis thermophila]
MAQAVAAPPDGSDAGEVIRWYRQHHNLTQQEAADLLNTTQSWVSKVEKGKLVPGLAELRWIAAKLHIPPERLGVLPDHSADAVPKPGQVSEAGAPHESQEHWKLVRRELNANRARLGDLASELYPQAHCIPGTTVLTQPGWLPSEPVELSDIELYWLAEALPKPAITGGIEQTESVRPLAADGEHFRLYSRALRDLARPKLLDNRVSYRLAEVDWTGDKGRLGFSYTTYFDVLDVCEAAAHEFADAWLRAGRKRPSLAHLPLRRHITDPFDLLARPMLPSINTLTIRRDPIDGHRMYLHRRDAKATAVAGGMFHVIPAGVFQPAALAPAHQANDFSLWRNIQREYSEEFLGNPEHDGNSLDPIDYEHDEPFRSFAAARAAGDFRVFTCAVVLEPLTLWVELLTVAVVEGPVFDQLFAGMVEVNEEGAAVSTDASRPTVGIPFNTESRERLKSEPLSPISRACIELAWQHRNTLLAS